MVKFTAISTSPAATEHTLAAKPPPPAPALGGERVQQLAD
jgi:hypothetical protein